MYQTQKLQIRLEWELQDTCDKKMNKSIILCTLMAAAGISYTDYGTEDEVKIEVEEKVETDEKDAETKEETEIITPKLISLSLFMRDNPVQLISDVKGNIIGDSIVECWVPNIMNDKQLIANFEYTGSQISIDSIPITSGISSFDFRKPVTLTVSSGDIFKDYTVYVHSFTGLPVLWIETEGRADVTSKETYLNASLKLIEDVKTRAAGDITKEAITIRGRGNTTWSMPKKPYQIKFNEKTSLIDEPADKTWVLLANYSDKTMVRVSTAFYMGKISNLDYTPRSHFVELILNGQYNGTYLLCEKPKIAKHRVNVGDDGFLLEVDAKAASDDITFKVSHLSQPVNIKDPDVKIGDENYTYISKHIEMIDSVLYSPDFTDEGTGWQKYMDMDSFVDWYLINEIAKNNDAVLYSSCYMNLKRGGKLKMGPLWDFDIAFGNINYNDNFVPEGFWIKNVSWFSRLFKDPAFVAKVKERFDFFYSHRNDIMRDINENAEYLRYAVQENENKWHTLYNYTWPNYNIWGNHQNEIQSMKEWLNTRFEWLKVEFEKM